MKKCLKCGYQRKPEDDKLTPQTDCPKCGAIYKNVETYQDKQKKAQIRKEDVAMVEKQLRAQTPFLQREVPPIASLFARIGVIVFLLITLYMLFTSLSMNSKPVLKEVVQSSAWDGSVYQVRDFLKTNLKDPDSFEAIEWSPVSKTGNGGYMVRCKYRAKNSFGGYVVYNQIFTMDSKGNVLDVSNF